MRGRVSLTVPVFTALPWNRLLQSGRHVPPHVRIRPLLEGHRRGGVRNKDMEQAVAPTPPGGGLLQ